MLTAEFAAVSYSIRMLNCVAEQYPDVLRCRHDTCSKGHVVGRMHANTAKPSEVVDHLRVQSEDKSLETIRVPPSYSV